VNEAETTSDVVSTTKQACLDSRENKNKQYKNENKHRGFRRFGIQQFNLSDRKFNKDNNARNDQNIDRRGNQNNNRRRFD